MNASPPCSCGRVLEEPEPVAHSAEHERLAIEALRTGEPVLALHAQAETPNEDGEPEPVGVELLIALPDRPGVLPAAAGVLALHRLTVRAADLRAVELPTELGAGAAADLLLLSWRVAAAYGSLPQASRLRADLVRALDGSLDIRARLAEREAAYPRRRGVKAPPPRVTVAAAKLAARDGDRGTGPGRPGAAAPDRPGAGTERGTGTQRARVDAGGERGGYGLRHA